eukprot:3935167-Rhodomonas_salina.5
MPGTESHLLFYALATRHPVLTASYLWPYALATACPVLKRGMLSPFGTDRNQTQETTFSAQFVPGMWFLIFEMHSLYQECGFLSVISAGARSVCGGGVAPPQRRYASAAAAYESRAAN